MGAWRAYVLRGMIDSFDEAGYESESSSIRIENVR
jgi:hypothetical protein